MKDWKWKKLGEICLIERGGSPRPIDDFITQDSNGINWIKIGDTTDSMYISHTMQKIRREGMRKSRYVSPGDFLLSNSMSFGRPYILKIDGCIHDGWLVIRDENNVFDKRFLYYYLSAPSTYRTFVSMAVGGVVNNLNCEMVRKLKVPIPNMAKQCEIADIFDKISLLIDRRKGQMQALDDLVKSQFIEMFDNKNYNVLKWNDVFDTNTGKLDSSAMVKNGKYPFFTCAKEIYRIDNYAFNQEALLLAGNNAQGKYDVKYYNGKFNAYQRTYILGLKGEWSYRLFQYQLEEKLEYLQEQSLGGLTKYLTLKILGKLEFVLPPIEEQKRFESFVKQIDKSKFTIQQSLNELENCYKALMQEYFG